MVQSQVGHGIESRKQTSAADWNDFVLPKVDVSQPACYRQGHYASCKIVNKITMCHIPRVDKHRKARQAPYQD